MRENSVNIKSYSIRLLTQTALLCAIGISIPMFMPRIPIEPMTFTLASHVAIFIAMFISPACAISVTIGTTVGFFFTASPIVALRAGSHIIFAVAGSLYLKKHPDLLSRKLRLLIFAFVISVIHAIAEAAVVSYFYFGGALPDGFYARGFVMGVMMLVGVGTLVHSMVDFALARLIWQPLKKIGI